MTTLIVLSAVAIAFLLGTAFGLTVALWSMPRPQLFRDAMRYDDAAALSDTVRISGVRRTAR